jgi:RNA polymerase sigma-70 factor (ECF subfamily)
VCESRLGDQRALVVDLAGVAYADGAGAELLRSFEDRGVELVGVNGFVSELLSRSARERRNGAQPARSTRNGHARGLAAGRSARAAVGNAQTPAGQSEEHALVARIRSGDDLAWELVVRRFAPRLLAVARRLLGNEDEACDALQTSFLSAYRSIDSFTGESQLSTWLHRIVVNASLMRLRTRRRRAEDSIEDLLPRFADDGHFAEPPTAWRSEELLERQQTRVMVRRSIERLPARHREVLWLRDIEELDTEETADLLGITVNAVKVRLHRARQALRTLIERELAQAA